MGIFENMFIDFLYVWIVRVCFGNEVCLCLIIIGYVWFKLFVIEFGVVEVIEVVVYSVEGRGV